jgi:RNA polymerase-binding transcription factor DksA
MIDQKLIAANKDRLLKEQTRLQVLLSRIAKPGKAAGEFQAKYPNFGDQEDENASEVETYEENIAEERDLAQKLRAVSAALERIAQGTYGICRKGGEEMPLERLAAIPEAENCIEHESAKE